MPEYNTKTAPFIQYKKKLHIEILRIFACFFVIFNHTGDNGCFLFCSCKPASLLYWAYCFLSIFCKFSVPLFFAISGALLLPKDESIKEVYGKRVLRFVLLTIFISAFYYCFNNNFDFSSLSLKAFLSIIYSSTMNFHLWYLYELIPFLMALPLIRPMVKSLQNKHFLYLALCSIVFSGILPVTEYFLWQGNLSSNIRLAWISPYVLLYPFIGYYIEHRMDVQRAKRKLPCLWAIDIAAILLSCAATHYRASIMNICNEVSSQAFHNSFVLVNVITIYITAKCLCKPERIKTAAANAICSLGSCTFGIYLFHVAVIISLYPYHILDFLRKDLGINSMISCLIYCTVIMLLSYVLTWLVKKIPLLKRLL